MDLAAPEPADFARYRVEPDERFSLSDDAPADTDGLYDEPRYVIALAVAARGRQAVR